MNVIFRGTATAMVTPFLENGEVDYDMFARQIEFQIASGTDALVILGTTGESATMTDEEDRAVLKFAIEKIAGRVPVIAGAGSNCTKHAVERCIEAEKLGADALLCVTPYYNKCTQNGLVQYYKDLAAATSLPIIAYNVPGRTGVNILPETMEKIADIENVVAIKEACGNLDQIAETAKRIKGKCALYSGDDGIGLDIMKMGGIGVISVATNVAPAQTKAMYDAYFAGNEEEAERINQSLQGLFSAMFIEVNPIPVKAALAMMDMGKNVLRAPLTPIEDQHVAPLRDALISAGIEIKVQL